LKVGLAAAQIGLQGYACIAVFSLNLFKDAESGVRAGGALHIDLDGIAHGRRSRGDLVRKAQAKFAIEIEAELGQFDGDVAVDSGIGERTEHPDIRIAGRAGLGRRGHIFAEVIQDYALAGASQRRDRFERLAESLPGDESAGEVVPGAEARYPIRHLSFCGQPEDQIAQRVRRKPPSRQLRKRWR
jgi:hypothetical protein